MKARRRRVPAWKFVAGFPNYMVSNDGRVMSLRKRTPIILKERIATAAGYSQVALYNGKRRDAYVAVIVARAFVPNPKRLPEVNHKDLDKQNNDYTNLEWSSHADNVRHAAENGVFRNRRFRYLTRAQVQAVLEFLKDGIKTQKQIAAMFGITEGTVQRMNTKGHRYA
jgi:hypothetical protein